MKNRKTVRLPLQGIRVLDLSRLIPGSFCTAMLADLGADVVKIEEPLVGDYDRQIPPFIQTMASRFLILNRNKKSLSLNLKTSEGKAIFLKLVEEADVVVESFRPGVMEKLHLAYDNLQQTNPRLICCSISSFGQDGPDRDAIAHDINILGLAGVLDITGEKGGRPVIPGIQIADSVAAMSATVAILAAVIARGQTNRGQYLDISMFDSVVAWIFDAARYSFAGADVPRRGEGRLWGGLPNYQLYQTKDDKYITVGSLETKFKKTLLRRLGREDLIGDESGATSAGAKEADKDLFAFLEETFRTKTRDEWMDELSGLNVCVGPVNTIEEALSHPQTLFRGMVQEIEHPAAGRVKQLGSPLKLSEIPVDVNRLTTPQLGEHTKEILSGLGYSEQEVEDLVERKIVGVLEEK